MAEVSFPKGAAHTPHHHHVRNAFGSAVPMGWLPAGGAPRVQAPSAEPPNKPARPPFVVQPPVVRFGVPKQQSTAVQSEDLRFQQLQSLLDFALKQVGGFVC
jgi:hypothetical protein